MELTNIIHEKDYPEIFKLLKKEREKKIEEIFKTGYNIHYPKIKSIKDNEYCQILKKLEDLQESNNLNETNEEYLGNQIEEMMTSIHKLTGVTNNSSKKGEVGEYMLDQVITQRYGDLIIENKAKTPHSGDAWLTFPDGKKIMLESKNYNYRVNKDELDKMENDMITNYMKFGIFISWCSTVQNRKDLDIHTFYHNGETYLIIVISNLSVDINKLDLAIQLTRKLLINFTDMKSFPWLIDDIKDNLGKLEGLINKNFKLRDKFYGMSNVITESLNNYYLYMREYQYDIEKNIKEIVDSIDSTIKESIKTNGTLNPNIKKFTSSKKWLLKYKKEKMYQVLEAIHDCLKKNKIYVLPSDDKDIQVEMIKESEKIGTIKIQKKKVLLSLQIGLNFDLDDKNYMVILPLLSDNCKKI